MNDQFMNDDQFDELMGDVDQLLMDRKSTRKK